MLIGIFKWKQLRGRSESAAARPDQDLSGNHTLCYCYQSQRSEKCPFEWNMIGVFFVSQFQEYEWTKNKQKTWALKQILFSENYCVQMTSSSQKRVKKTWFIALLMINQAQIPCKTYVRQTFGFWNENKAKFTCLTYRSISTLRMTHL